MVQRWNEINYEEFAQMMTSAQRKVHVIGLEEVEEAIKFVPKMRQICWAFLGQVGVFQKATHQGKLKPNAVCVITVQHSERGTARVYCLCNGRDICSSEQMLFCLSISGFLLHPFHQCHQLGNNRLCCWMIIAAQMDSRPNIMFNWTFVFPNSSSEQ